MKQVRTQVPGTKTQRAKQSGAGRSYHKNMEWEKYKISWWVGDQFQGWETFFRTRKEAEGFATWVYRNGNRSSGLVTRD